MMLGSERHASPPKSVRPEFGGHDARDRSRPQADLVPEERQCARAERRAETGVDAGEGGPHDGEPVRRRHPPAADEADLEPEPLHLGGDLGPGAVDDADRVLARHPRDEARRLSRDGAAELDDHEAHVR